MQPQTHLFIIDPIHTLKLEIDTSLRLAKALFFAGEKVYYCTPADMSWQSGCPHPRARTKSLSFAKEKLQFTQGPPELRELDSFRAIHMRKDPPFDITYIGVTWFLDRLPPSTVVYNRPEALRSINEKLSLLYFPEFAKKSLVSTCPEEVYDFIHGPGLGDGIIKPLNLFGGKNIQRFSLEGKSRQQCLTELRKILASGEQKLVQAFDSSIFEGEVRVFTAFAQPISWCLKVPQKGEFLANTGKGAILKSYQPSKKEEENIVSISKKLLEHGIVFAGYDVIGGSVTEINVTSPRLLASGDIPEYPFQKMAELVLLDLKKKY